MSHCCICGGKKKVKEEKYDSEAHHGMHLLRMHDRTKVCSECHTMISTGQLMRLHSQLPLPHIKHSHHCGLFVTKTYLNYEKICEYFGIIIEDYAEAESDLSSSHYIINLFVDEPDLSERRYIEGDVENCDGRSEVFSLDFVFLNLFWFYSLRC